MKIESHKAKSILVRRYSVPFLSLAFLSTGAALLMYILFRVSLGLALICSFAFVIAVLARRFYAIDLARRLKLIRQIGSGVLIGLLATAAYDLSRLAIVEIFAMNVWPFEALRFFGHAIAGEGISRSTAIAVGALYHVTNGIFFSVSYCLLLAGRSWIHGVIWALGLEVLMFTIYPTWLNLDAVIKEFTIVSLAGHLAYGSVLGVMARHWIEMRAG